MTLQAKLGAALLALIATCCMPAAAQDFSQATITTVPVRDGIYMLMGQGGNIGVSTGADGMLLIDDQYAPMNDKIVAALAALPVTGAGRGVRMVLNTHWHRDHTGGNELFAESGALVVAHDNVRTRMSATHFSSFFRSESPPSPAAALPIVTFDRSVTLHVNGLTIRAEHVPPAHTDGDSIVWFDEANVVHLGDTYFNGLYPFIDVDSGGSVRGMMAAIDGVLPRVDEATRIMPGHGPLSDRAGLLRYRAMLVAVTEEIDRLITAGRSREETIAAKPSAAFDADWGGGFIKPDRWVGLVYESMAADR